jgi:hypothetical protein
MITSKYADCNNGIAAFADLITKYGGSPTVHLIRYERELDIPFSFSYKGGLSAYLKNFEENFVKHTETENKLALLENRDTLARHDDHKRDKLYKNLYHEQSMRNTIRLARARQLSYQELLTYLHEEAILVDHYENAYARSKSTRKVNQTEVNLEEYHALMQRLSKELVLSSDLYRCIPEDARVEFNNKRKALQEQRNKSSTPGQSNPNQQSGQLPRQYSQRANVTDIENEQTTTVVDAGETFDEADDILVDTQSFINHLNTYNDEIADHVHERTCWNMVRTTTIRNNISLHMSESILLSDNGANASLISTSSFHIDHVVPGRQATIKGCKEDYVSKRHSIGTGRTIICFKIDNVNYEMGLRINEATIHDDKLSILSEVQALSHGIELNSFAQRFKHLLNMEDSQYMRIDNTRIPLDMNEGLMTFTIRRPTDHELDDKDFKWHDITSDEEWSPHDMKDNDDVTSFDPTIATTEVDIHEEFFECEPIDDDSSPSLDSGGVQTSTDLSEFLDPYNDIQETEQDKAVVVLELYRDLLGSEDDVDVFLNYLDQDTLFGLKYQLSPVEYAIHCIKKRNGLLNEDDVSTTTVATDNTTTEKTKSLESDGEVQPSKKTPHKDEQIDSPDDEFDETGEQMAPNVIVGKHSSDDPEKIRPYLGYQPIQVVRETLKRTTRAAKAIIRLPFIRHIAARFAWMNRHKLREKVATDVLFAHVKAIGGYDCAQVFYGMTSRCINVYGMKSKSEFPKVYQDFLRNEGIPTVLRRDGAKEEDSIEVTKLQRKYLIKDEYSEPYNQQQNPVELNAVKWLKHNTERLLDRTGAPGYLWLYAMKYNAGIHNTTAKESMRWDIPLRARYGETPDISKYLAFKFYERVYHSEKQGFGEINEQMGYWLGPSENVGDVLCHTILTDKGSIIHRSVVRSAEDKSLLNKRLNIPDEPEPQKYTPIFEEPASKGFGDDDFPGTPEPDDRRTPVNDRRPKISRAPSSDPPRRSTRNKSTTKNLVIDAFDNAKSYYSARMNGHLDPQYHVPILIDNYEYMNIGDDTSSGEASNDDISLHDESIPDHMSAFNDSQLNNFRYYHLCDAWMDDKDNNWTPISVQKHFNNRNNPEDVHTVVKVIWLNGEQTIERLDEFSRDHPNMIVTYAHDHNLQNKGEFSWTSRYKKLDKTDTLFSFFHMSLEQKAVMASRFHGQSKFQFGVEVPRHVAHALYLDKMNGNSLWADAISKELGEINAFKTFRLAIESDNLDEYQRIPYHIVFAVKFDGRRKARLVMGGNVTDTPKEEVYSGVVNISSVRLAYLVSVMNNLKICAADVGNAFLNGINKEPVYIVAGQEFGELKGKNLIVYKSC